MSVATMGAAGWVPFLAGLASLGAAFCFILIRVLRPWLVRYALARPSARGLHTTPTPQGGGVAVLITCATVALAGAAVIGLDADDFTRLGAVLGGAAVLGSLGLVDDIRPLPAGPRLAIQLAVMAVGVLALPAGTRVLPFLPEAVEIALLVIGGAWFINLTNFMDGMDWMTVVEMVPLTLVLVLSWVGGFLPTVPGLLALGLFAGLVGYAPYNRPVARLFLGDVGSLPIGFLAAYGLFSLGGSDARDDGGALAAAVLFALYYIVDSGVTLAWRVRHGHRVWEPHRSHFYQVAVARGLTVPEVLSRVGVTNLALCLLGAMSLTGSTARQALALLLGGLVVAVTLASLSRGAPRR